ncbi:hypothetical protein DY048_01350 [Apilactobacillus timberlakei]|uniref:Uncharacterized protein n=1 Tax=Apilactobacillus timberlakei TaxID=2008380 RepID=A0ABY2YZ07_9LACO|nr:hypothetical protein DY052_04135 [Apilactobacillus timberlakei]TPR16136.1 hypothetical protein DY048_01350 [Apilactobacillus timberlakei]
MANKVCTDGNNAALEIPVKNLKIPKNKTLGANSCGNKNKIASKKPIVKTRLEPIAKAAKNW